ncbi:tetratricopeptide repeat protein, partial [Myxococcota bacterium]|nr:tetratricopeptide repeat protein [Myxococcota bacterium]
MMAKRGNHGGAATLLEEVVAREITIADPLDLVLELITEWAKSGLLEEARNLASNLHTNHPKDERILASLVRFNDEVGASKKAVEWQRKVLALAPDKLENKILLARLLNDAGKGSEIPTMLEPYAEEAKKTKNPEILIELGRSWIKPDPVTASNYFKEALKLEKRGSIYILIGNVHLQVSRNDEAIKAFHEASKIDPTILEGHFKIAKIELERGYSDKAAKELRALLAKSPGNADAAELLADTLLDLGEAEEALQWYQNALAANGDTPDLLTKTALVQLQRLGRTRASIATFNRVLKLDPSRVENYYHIGMAYKDEGQPKKAKKALRHFISKAPESVLKTDAQSTLEEMENQ